jgi:hypothetical protein
MSRPYTTTQGTSTVSCANPTVFSIIFYDPPQLRVMGSSLVVVLLAEPWSTLFQLGVPLTLGFFLTLSCC